MKQRTLPGTIRREEVAYRLGRTVSWFDKNRERLHREHGFPAPVASALGGVRFNEAAVDAWIAAQVAPAQPSPHPEPRVAREGDPVISMEPSHA